MSEIRDLKPARPDAEQDREQAAYMPRLPWKWIVGLGLLSAVGLGTCQLQHRAEMSQLRGEILEAHQKQLGPHVARYQALKQKLLRHTVSVAGETPERFADPRLKLDALGSDTGLYLRLMAEDAHDPEELGKRALSLPPDAIARCLGIAPLPAIDLLLRGSFLDDAFIAQADEADTVIRLRVIAEELRQRSERDLPRVSATLDARWFMLVLQQGQDRKSAPVDVYLWDLKTDKLLLSDRVRAEGALVAARIAVQGVKPGAYAAGSQTGAAQDCSIASKLRTLVGGGGVAFESAPPEPRAAALAETADASASTDAAVEAATKAP